MASQDAYAERVERAEPHALGHAADHRRDPLAHLACRLVGEGDGEDLARPAAVGREEVDEARRQNPGLRSEEHTSELQSLMRISYAVFCLKKKKRRSE